jgi:hypothetical protein
VTADQSGQKNRNGKRLRFFFTMFSTSEKRGTQRAGVAPSKLAMAMADWIGRASNRTWRKNRGVVAHDGRAKLYGGHEAASEGLVGEERGLEKGS